MSFSSGTFSINSSGQPVVTGTVISSTAFNALTADLATGLSTCVLKDGTQTLTANIPMGGFKFTGLAAGSAAGNSVRYEQAFIINVAAGGNLLFTDATYDIGASGATRPRDFFLSRNAVIGGTSLLTGAVTNSTLTASRAVASDASKVLVSLDAPIVNTLSGDVALNNTANYFTGPTCAQGTTGTWFASGSVELTDSAGAATFICKLWDGTTVIASAAVRTTAAGTSTSCHLSGFLASPAGNIRISVKDSTSTSGTLQYNGSGESNDATLSVIRLF